MAASRKVGQLANPGQRQLVAAAVKVIRSRGWFRVTCPVCPSIVGTPDRHGTLSIKGATEGFRCFRCGIYGSLPSSKSRRPVQEVEEAATAYVAKNAPRWFHDASGEVALTSLACRPGIAYAEGRGFDEAIRLNCGMGLAIGGPQNESIVVPHADANGTWWGFTARKWYDKCEQPYDYPRGMTRDRMIHDQVFQVDTEDPVLMMEGSLDCVLFWDDAAGHMGKPIEAHVDVVRKTRRPVVSVLDGDAWRVGQNFMYLLRMNGVKAGAVRLPPGRDPNQPQHVDPGAIRRAALESLTAQRAIVVPETI